LACGGGRQSIVLARLGCRVLGVDEQEAAFARARQAACQESLNIHFLKTDIRCVSYRGEFDAVVNLSCPIGGLPNERDHARVLDGARKALKPGGKLLLDWLNKEWLIRHLDRGTGDEAPCFDFESGRLESRRDHASLRVYSLTEIRGLLERCGLIYRKAWGGYDGQAYGLESPRMVVLAERAADEPPKRRRQTDELESAIRIKGRGKAR
jgi:SAM-dependent methyltransferase